MRKRTDKVRKQIRAAQLVCQIRRRKLINELKNRPCLDCGGWFECYAMDFDHRPGEIKSFHISDNANHRMEILLDEIKKCDVVCANCHRIRTVRRNQHGAGIEVLAARNIDNNVI